jgi:hypothetical protein
MDTQASSNETDPDADILVYMDSLLYMNIIHYNPNKNFKEIRIDGRKVATVLAKIVHAAMYSLETRSCSKFIDE